jgi:hypothetical protein
MNMRREEKHSTREREKEEKETEEKLFSFFSLLLEL